MLRESKAVRPDSPNLLWLASEQGDSQVSNYILLILLDLQLPKQEE